MDSPLEPWQHDRLPNFVTQCHKHARLSPGNCDTGGTGKMLTLVSLYEIHFLCNNTVSQ